MDKEKVIEIIKSVCCRECGAIYGYEEHDEMVEKAANKIIGTNQKTTIESIIETYEDQIEIHTKISATLKKQKRYHDWYWQRGLVEGYRRVIEKLKGPKNDSKEAIAEAR